MIIILVLLLCATTTWAAPAAPPTNLALNHPYASNVQALPGWTGLADGDKASDSAPGCFGTANDTTYPKYVVIDLGSACQISKVVVCNSANGNTRTVSVACSPDGANYKKLRDPDFIFTAGDPTALTLSFQPRTARYVRVTMPDSWKGGLGGDNCLFLREIEVYGVHTGDSGKGDPFAFAASQAPFATNRSTQIFKRYCLDGTGELHVTVVGDTFTTGFDQDAHWAKVVATEISRLYPNKQTALTGVGGTDGAVGFGLDWAKDHRGVLAPDLILVAYGTQAALANASPDEFRQKYQALLAELTENTRSLIVAVTPLPFLPPDAHDSRPYADAVEQIALANDLPLLRTAAVLSKIPGDKSVLYADNTHLSAAGHEAIGTALADLLR
jgi:lysophospholipase L1-like esterase